MKISVNIAEVRIFVFGTLEKPTVTHAERRLNRSMLIKEGREQETVALPPWFVRGLVLVLREGPTEVELNSDETIKIDDIWVRLEDYERTI